MAKQVMDAVAQIIYMSLSKIWSFREDNPSRGFPAGDATLPLGYFEAARDRDELVAQLVPEGFKPHLGIAGLYSLTPALKKRAVQEIKAFGELLEKAPEVIEIKIDGQNLAIKQQTYINAFNLIHYEKGKIIEPEYGLVFGHRRTVIMPFVNAVRNQLGMHDILEIPVSVKNYANDLERHTANVEENTLKMAGAKTLDHASKVRAAYKLYSEGANENRLRKVFKDGMGQKLYAIMQINNLHPDLKVVETIQNDEKLFPILDREDLRKLAKEGTTETVEKYLKDPKAGRKQSVTPIAPGKDIRARAQQSPVKAIRFILGAVVHNDLALLNKLTDLADGLNKAWDDVVGIEPAAVDETPDATEE